MWQQREFDRRVLTTLESLVARSFFACSTTLVDGPLTTNVVRPVFFWVDASTATPVFSWTCFMIVPRGITFPSRSVWGPTSSESVSIAPLGTTGAGAVLVLAAPDDPQMDGGARAWTGAGADGPREGNASSDEVLGAFLAEEDEPAEGPLDDEPLTEDRGASSTRLGNGSGAPSKAWR